MYEREITIVGYGAERRGTTNGKVWAFVPVHVTYASKFAVGEVTDTWLMSPEMFDEWVAGPGDVLLALVNLGKRKNGTYGITYGTIVRRLHGDD